MRRTILSLIGGAAFAIVGGSLLEAQASAQPAPSAASADQQYQKDRAEQAQDLKTHNTQDLARLHKHMSADEVRDWEAKHGHKRGCTPDQVAAADRAQVQERTKLAQYRRSHDKAALDHEAARARSIEDADWEARHGRCT